MAYFATIEIDGVVQPEPEAMILLTDEDQHGWMRNSRLDGSIPDGRHNGEIDPRPFVHYLSHGQRMLLVSDYIESPALESMFCAYRDYPCELEGGDADGSNTWTKVIFADEAPMTATYQLRPSHPGCTLPNYGTNGKLKPPGDRTFLR